MTELSQTPDMPGDDVEPASITGVMRAGGHLVTAPRETLAALRKRDILTDHERVAEWLARYPGMVARLADHARVLGNDDAPGQVMPVEAFYCERCPWTNKHAHCQECDWPIAPGMTICGECGCEQDGE